MYTYILYILPLYILNVAFIAKLDIEGMLEFNT